MILPFSVDRLHSAVNFCKVDTFWSPSTRHPHPATADSITARLDRKKCLHPPLPPLLHTHAPFRLTPKVHCTSFCHDCGHPVQKSPGCNSPIGHDTLQTKRSMICEMLFCTILWSTAPVIVASQTAGHNPSPRARAFVHAGWIDLMSHRKLARLWLFCRA